MYSVLQLANSSITNISDGSPRFRFEAASPSDDLFLMCIDAGQLNKGNSPIIAPLETRRNVTEERRTTTNHSCQRQFKCLVQYICCNPTHD